ncbi:MAG TPA: PH domain-containing protein [Gemmatimonadales bacterium]
MTETFAIAPAGSRPLWFLLPLGLVLLTVLAILLSSLYSSRGARFDVSPDGLRLRGDLYGRTIPAMSLRAGEARRVNLEAEAELRPKWRTLGTGLPGYQAGWFRLRDGQKALVYLTDRSRAVYVPTTEGYGLLLSPEHPDRFLAAVQRLGRQESRR